MMHLNLPSHEATAWSNPTGKLGAITGRYKLVPFPRLFADQLILLVARYAMPNEDAARSSSVRRILKREEIQKTDDYVKPVILRQIVRPKFFRVQN